MAQPPIQWREPQSFTAGDTLSFQRRLPEYLPSDGWSIHGVVSKANDIGAMPVARFVSGPDGTNSFHVIYVQNFLAGATDGVYIFSEEIINANTGDKHQIWFFDDFLVGPDLNDGLAGGQVKTHSQRALDVAFDAYLEIIKSKFAETEVQRNRFSSRDEEKALMTYKYWKSVRIQEIQYENARNGRPSGAVSQPVLMIG